MADRRAPDSARRRHARKSPASRHRREKNAEQREKGAGIMRGFTKLSNFQQTAILHY